MLRFKRDDGSEYSKFQVCRIKDILDLLTDYDANGSFKTVAENVKTFDGKGYAWYVRMTDLSNNTPLDQVKYVDKESYEFLKKTKLYGGELLIAKRGDIGTIHLFKKKTDYATLAPNMYLLKLNNRALSAYIYRYFESIIGQKKLMKINASSTMGALYKDDVKNIKVNLPCIEEQQKIADFLSEVDNIITASEQEIESLEMQKKGAMQKIFSQEVRFKADDGSDYPEWEEKTFSQVMESFEYGMNSAAIEYDGENKYLRITDIDEISHRYSSDNIVSPSGELDDKYLVKEGDIFFARTGASVGKTYLYRLEDGKMYFAGFLIKGHVKEEFVPYYIFCHTLTEKYKKWVKVMSVRSGQPGINSQEFASYKFLCSANKEEQQKIADFLSEFDNALEYAKEELEIWKNIKKGLLQQMFE